MNILLVDDDRDLVDLLTFVFQRAGFETIPAYDPAAALKRLNNADIVILDVNLGRESGFDVLPELRKRSDIPVIMLTARGGEEDIVKGLELGADDYVTKPFNHRELVARVRTQLRGREPKAADQQRSSLNIGPLSLDVPAHAVFKDGKAVTLSLTEFRLLHYLMLHAGSVVSSQALLRQVWGYEDAAANDVVRVAVYRLRRKLEDDPSNPVLLETVPGLGIKLRTPEGWNAEPAQVTES
ncbi:MAG TPA: response regulator transcription factor [Chloroflexota bacterium]